MSQGFAGSTTRKLEGFEREVTTHMDRFTDEFSPPVFSEKEKTGEDFFRDEFKKVVSEDFKGADFSKTSNNYQDKHDDVTPKPDLESAIHSRLAAAGKASDQPALDFEDEQLHKDQANIKPQSSQFPGAKMKRKLSTHDHELAAKTIEHRLAAYNEAKVAKVMKEFYDGTLKDSAGNVVTDEQQAKAIAVSEAKRHG